MKTFNEFQQQTNKLNEGVPALAVAGKVIGAGLAAYSAYDAVKQLKKGNYGRAALSALGAVPGGKIFQGVKFASKSDKIAKGVKGLSTANKFIGPDGRNFVADTLSNTTIAKNKTNKNKIETAPTNNKTNKNKIETTPIKNKEKPINTTLAFKPKDAKIRLGT